MTFNSAQLQDLTPEQVKDIAEGRLLLMDVLGVTPGEMLHHLDTAMNLITIGKLDDATRILKGLAALDVRNPAFVSALGSIELMRKNYPAAIEYAQRAVQIDEKFATAYYVLGESLAQLKRTDEAVSAFDKAFELRPDDQSRDARRCRTIYLGLTGKQAPGGAPAAAAPGRAPMPAGAPGSRPPAPAPIRPIPRAVPVAVGRGTSHGGAFGRTGGGPQMISRAGGGAPPMRA